MNDYVLNGQPHGSIANRLLRAGGDPGALRPYVGDDGRSYVTINHGGKPTVVTTNAPATLRKDEWQLLDETIIRVAKERLAAWGDIMGRGLRYTIPNGMSKTVLQYQDVSDISPATISMDGLRQSDRDRPVYDITNLPLPIIHKDFSFSLREILVSRTSMNSMSGGGAASLDTTTAQLAGRRVAEEVEKLLLGVTSSYTYGGGTIYGYTNFPSRATKVMTAPTGLNPSVTLAEVLAMKAQSQALKHFGPWMLYTSLGWDPYLDNDYILVGGTSTYSTLRQRIGMIDGIMGIRTLDYLPAKTMLLVEMNPDVVRGVVGMEVTTLEWETSGGMELNFKVMCIMVPQLRKDQLGSTGIVHGTHP